MRRASLGGAVPHGPQVAPLDELHRDVELFVHLAGVEDLHEVRVVEADRYLGFVKQPVGERRLVVGLQHLLDQA